MSEAFHSHVTLLLAHQSGMRRGFMVAFLVMGLHISMVCSSIDLFGPLKEVQISTLFAFGVSTGCFNDRVKLFICQH